MDLSAADEGTFLRWRYDVHTAEDLAIDSLFDLIVHPRRYNFKTPLKTYLFAIGHNKAVNYIKRHSRVVPCDLTEAELADERSLEDELIRDEEKLSVSRALADLPADMRSAVHLVYFEELSYEQAAKIMKKSKKQVDNLLYRARAHLKEELSEKAK